MTKLTDRLWNGLGPESRYLTEFRQGPTQKLFVYAM